MSEQESPPELVREIQKLNTTLRKANSFWRIFLVGIVRGLGAAIGATLIAALALTVLWRFVRTVGLEDVVRKAGIAVPSVPEGAQGGYDFEIPPLGTQPRSE